MKKSQKMQVWNNNKNISSGAQYAICTVKLDEEKSKNAGLEH
jgi:hypothetical protein